MRDALGDTQRWERSGECTVTKHNLARSRYNGMGDSVRCCE